MTTTRPETAGPFPARAKVNLYLRVTGRRDDGYHEIDSLFVRADLADRLWLTPADEDGLEIAGPFAEALDGERAGDNLVMRALSATREASGRSDRFHVGLEKNIPVAAGLGGGSADAAATLRAAAGLLDFDGDLASLALSLGADAPACLTDRPTLVSGIGERVRSLVSGIGERVAPAPALPPCALVLVNPRAPVSTAAAFARRRGGFSAPRPLDAPAPSLDALTAALAARGNDLEAAAIALEPTVAEALDALAIEPTVRLARMSGSGATCFGLVETLAEARSAADAITARHPGWWCEAAAVLPADREPALPLSRACR